MGWAEIHRPKGWELSPSEVEVLAKAAAFRAAKLAHDAAVAEHRALENQATEAGKATHAAWKALELAEREWQDAALQLDPRSRVMSGPRPLGEGVRS